MNNEVQCPPLDNFPTAMDSTTETRSLLYYNSSTILTPTASNNVKVRRKISTS